MPAELLAVRLSSFAKSSGVTTRKMKPPGSERKTYSRTTPTCFLANPNLEGEIHLKGGRFVTSQIFNLECYTLGHHAYHIFLAFSDPRKFHATQGPSERVGDFEIFLLILFITSSTHFPISKKNMRGNNMTFPKFRKNEDLINKSHFGFSQNLFALGKNACFQKLHFRPRVKVHFVRLIFRSRGKFTL